MSLLTLLRAENLSLRQALWLKAEEVDGLIDRLAGASASPGATATAATPGMAAATVTAGAVEETRGDVEAETDAYADGNGDGVGHVDLYAKAGGKRGGDGKQGNVPGSELGRKVERLEAKTEGLERRVVELCRRWVGEWEEWIEGRLRCAEGEGESCSEGSEIDAIAGGREKGSG